MSIHYLVPKPGADPLGGPEGPWPPQLGQGAPARGKCPQFWCKITLSAPAGGQKCPPFGADHVTPRHTHPLPPEPQAARVVARARRGALHFCLAPPALILWISPCKRRKLRICSIKLSRAEQIQPAKGHPNVIAGS